MKCWHSSLRQNIIDKLKIFNHTVWPYSLPPPSHTRTYEGPGTNSHIVGGGWLVKKTTLYIGAEEEATETMKIIVMMMTRVTIFCLPRVRGTTGPWRTLCLRILCPSLAARSTLQTPSEKVSKLNRTELCCTGCEHCNKTPSKILSQSASRLEPKARSLKHTVHWTLQTAHSDLNTSNWTENCAH